MKLLRGVVARVHSYIPWGEEDLTKWITADSGNHPRRGRLSITKKKNNKQVTDVQTRLTVVPECVVKGVVALRKASLRVYDRRLCLDVPLGGPRLPGPYHNNWLSRDRRVCPRHNTCAPQHDTTVTGHNS